jgi:integrase/recombinase XerD
MSGGRFGPTKASERRCTPLALWPQADRQAWEDALTPGTLLDDHLGARANLSAQSNFKTERGYGRFLTYCRIYDPACLDEPPVARITKDRVRNYVRHLMSLENSSQTILCRLQELGDIAWAFSPAHDWSFINRIASRIRARHTPARSKNRIMMSDELAQLGYDLMDQAGDEAGVKAACQFRDGLMIALLAYVPIRRKNFARLSLGENLVKRQNRWLIMLTPEETKTHAWFQTIWPVALEPYLARYLERHRPCLVANIGRWSKPTGTAVWVSSHSSPMTEIAIYDRICRQTRKHFGAHVSPHLFRDAAASTLATEAPAHVRIAAPLLGHRSFQTTEKYYRKAKAQEGHGRFIETISNLRGEV